MSGTTSWFVGLSPLGPLSLSYLPVSQSVSQSDETRLVSVKDSQLNWLLLYYWPPLPPFLPPPRQISRVLGGESAGGAWL